MNTPELIEYGLIAARASGWVRPPSAGQFCKWCWEESMKTCRIPTVEQAQKVIQESLRTGKRNFTGALNQISTELEWYRLKQSSYEEVNAAVAIAHDKTIRWWKLGKPFREPVENSQERIEQKPPAPMSHKESKKMLGAIMQQAGL